MRFASALFATALIATSPANAEVTAQADNGFAVSHTVSVSVDPEEAFAMLRTPAKWWAKEHTWTGASENLYMDAQAGGCFCELIPNEVTTESGAPQRTLRGSVQHMQISYVDPGKMLRMSGALGPLQGEAMTGTLTITLAPVKGGTQLTVDYVAGGYMRMPVSEVAPAVDSVIGEQASRLAMALGPLVGGGKPDPVEKADPTDTGTSASVTDLVADLEPDDGDGDVKSDAVGDDPAPDAQAVTGPPRSKPGTKPLGRRVPAAESDPESSR